MIVARLHLECGVCGVEGEGPDVPAGYQWPSGVELAMPAPWQCFDPSTLADLAYNLSTGELDMTVPVALCSPECVHRWLHLYVMAPLGVVHVVLQHDAGQVSYGHDEWGALVDEIKPAGDGTSYDGDAGRPPDPDH